MWLLCRKHIYKCIDDIFCLEFQRYSLKFCTNDQILTLKDGYKVRGEHLGAHGFFWGFFSSLSYQQAWYWLCKFISIFFLTLQRMMVMGKSVTMRSLAYASQNLHFVVLISVSLYKSWDRCFLSKVQWNIEGSVQERRNSSALAMELRLSCSNPSLWWCR